MLMTSWRFAQVACNVVCRYCGGMRAAKGTSLPKSMGWVKGVISPLPLRRNSAPNSAWGHGGWCKGTHQRPTHRSPPENALYTVNGQSSPLTTLFYECLLLPALITA